MSGKRVKRERKVVKETMGIMAPLAPILAEAAEDLESPESFQQWSMLALAFHLYKPNVPLEFLLPSELGDTLRRNPDFLDQGEAEARGGVESQL